MKDEYWYKLHEMVWSKEPYIMLGAIRRFMQNVSEKERRARRCDRGRGRARARAHRRGARRPGGIPDESRRHRARAAAEGRDRHGAVAREHLRLHL